MKSRNNYGLNNTMNAKYRHELKYVINAKEDVILSSISRGIMQPDPHAEDGRYYIRSLYFDDAADTCYYENEAGTDPRCKYRLRYYGSDLSYMVLEKKSKVSGMTHKDAYRVTEAEARVLMSGSGDYSSVNNPLAQEMTIKRMFPKVIVSYEREPYIYEAGNIRITFDRSISSSAQVDRFLDGDYAVRPVMPSGHSILETKWDELMPSFIKDSLCTRELVHTAYSKYYMCRNYHL